MNQALIIISVFVSLVQFSFVSAQLIPEGYDTLSYSHEITVRGNLDYYGTSVQNDIISKFIRGGQITEENKDNSLAISSVKRSNFSRLADTRPRYYMLTINGKEY